MKCSVNKRYELVKMPSMLWRYVVMFLSTKYEINKD